MSENEKRPQFGNRFLTNEENVFKHNAWDDVEWSEDQLQEAKKMVAKNAEQKLSDEKRNELEKEAHMNWDKFYDIHANRFFKDRNWLFTELPELSLLEESGKKSLLEIGCGSGSTVYPLLKAIQNKQFLLYCCDYSEKAVELVKSVPDFEPDRCKPFRCNVTLDKDWKESPLEPNSLDMVLMIFAVSAMEPETMKIAASKAFEYLKPGGLLFFRDYGQYDLAQLRFKNGKCIRDDFYMRGDGTRCYFFTPQFVDDLFISAGFEKKQLKEDRRLQVNRGKHLKMYRVWIQGKYLKPI